MDFKIFPNNSSALKTIIYNRGWDGRTSFSLDIEKGPLLDYYLRHFRDDGEFHVGCSDDSRPPNFYFEYSMPIEADPPLAAEKKIVYRRHLFKNVCEDNEWFRDRNGMRDLEKVAEAFSDPENYNEKLEASLNIYKKAGYGVSLIDQDISVELGKGRLIRANCGTEISKNSSIGLCKKYFPLYEFKNFVGPDSKLDSRYSSINGVGGLGYELLECGTTLPDVVGEIINFAFADNSNGNAVKGYDFENQKSVRESVLGKVPVPDHDWLLENDFVRYPKRAR